MKAVFVGGGSFRLLGILRSAMAEPGVFDGGEIGLYDLDAPRAEAMGRMLMKTPEFARARPRVAWGASLDRALEGADAVGVILMAGSRLSHALSEVACLRHGFLGSDNVSPSGAMLALKGGPILMDLARRMERRSPGAWLMDFANPVAVLSAAVSNHTRIRALGVCQGFTNHQWDLSRLLLGKDEQRPDFDVDVAGVNHLSFIVRGSLRGKDLVRLLDRRLTPDWKPPRLHARWGPVMRRNITFGLRTLARLWRELGILVFSTEGDGMMHLMYDEFLRRARLRGPLPSRASVAAAVNRGAAQRRREDRRFRSYLATDLDEKFWSGPAAKDFLFQRQDHDIFVQVLRGIAGVSRAKIATSRPGRGAVAGFDDRTVLEYSQFLRGRALGPAPRLAVPDVVHGLVSALATHQTMLGDALATGDPKLLAQALVAYPVRPYSPALKALYKDLLEINEGEIPAPLRRAREHL